MDGQEILDRRLDVIELRRKVGMVFQKPTPFAKSIYENVAYGLRIAGVRDRRMLDEAVEKSLQRAGPLGRGQGPAARVGPGALRRPAPAAVHRPGDRRAARRSFSWTSPVRRWTRVRRRASRT